MVNKTWSLEVSEGEEELIDGFGKWIYVPDMEWYFNKHFRHRLQGEGSALHGLSQ
jgi:hypothetical protein